MSGMHPPALKTHRGATSLPSCGKRRVSSAGKAVAIVSCMRHICFQPFITLAPSSKLFPVSLLLEISNTVCAHDIG